MILRRGLRRWLRLPPARFRLREEQVAVPMADGVRLATTLLLPEGDGAHPTLVLRTPYGARSFPPLLHLLGRVLGESGYNVVLQDVRGRYASEGRFEPFVHEAADGADTLEWVAKQPWFRGRLGLIGLSYLGYAAWAALGRATVPVDALVVGIGTRDLYRAFYTAGVFGLATSLEWAVGVGERATLAPRRLDLPRGLGHRPVTEADRVTRRSSEAFQDWLAHPTRDAYWDALLPSLPDPMPPTLLLGGWYDFFLEPQLADHAAVLAMGDAHGAPDLRLVIGPWRHGTAASPEGRGREAGFAGVLLRETLTFLGRVLGPDPSESRGPAARIFVQGEGWHAFDRWPPPRTEVRGWYLHGATPDGVGGLRDEPPEIDAPRARYRYDPRDPMPGDGSPRLRSGGPADQRGVESRTDVSSYTTAPLTEPLRLCGAVRLQLHASSSAIDSDFAARLVRVDPAGVPRLLCEGITRARWRNGGDEVRWLVPGEPAELEIELGSTACLLPRGHRLRLDITSSIFPRFERNGNVAALPATVGPEEAEVADQQVWHDAAHPSRLTVTALPDVRAGSGDPSGPRSRSET